MSDAVIRWAKPSDIASFYGKPSDKTVRAIVIDIDGHPCAIGGLAMECGEVIAFMDLTPQVRHKKKSMLRAVKMAMDMLIRKSMAPVYAIASADEPTAKKFLAHLGFTQIEGSEVFQWQA